MGGWRERLSFIRRARAQQQYWYLKVGLEDDTHAGMYRSVLDELLQALRVRAGRQSAADGSPKAMSEKSRAAAAEIAAQLSAQGLSRVAVLVYASIECGDLDRSRLHSISSACVRVTCIFHGPGPRGRSGVVADERPERSAGEVGWQDCQRAGTAADPQRACQRSQG